MHCIGMAARHGVYGEVGAELDSKLERDLFHSLHRLLAMPGEADI